MGLSIARTGITLGGEVPMPAKRPRSAKAKRVKKPTATKPASRPTMSPARAKLIDELVRQLDDEIRERVGPHATFEEEGDAAFEIMRDVLWKREDARLRTLVTDADEVDVDGKKFRRMQRNPSTAA